MSRFHWDWANEEACQLPLTDCGLDEMSLKLNSVGSKDASTESLQYYQELMTITFIFSEFRWKLDHKTQSLLQVIPSKKTYKI